MKTYSFKDSTLVLNHPLVGPFVAAGKVGLGNMSVNMATDRTSHDTAADGTVMVSYISGDSGGLVIELQQTSDLHQYLVNWYNACKTAADNGDVSNWATMSAKIRNLIDGTGHQGTGVSPQKLPDKPYQAQGSKITWTLPCADLQTA